MGLTFTPILTYGPFQEFPSACVAVAAIVLIASLMALGGRGKRRKQWKEICQRVVRERDEAHHKVLASAGGDGLEKRQEREAEDAGIARLTATELLGAMRGGTISSERAVLAFCRRARAIGLLKTRAVTQEFYDEAVEAAAVIDDRRLARGSEGHNDSEESAGGVLEGVPVSIKDTIHMKGALATCGMACKAAVGPSAEDGLLVKALRAHGAIPFVRGNVPQCLMLPESDNAIWGRSANPWNQDRTPGGSSGGEGSLVASRCTPISLGSDVGGSVRIPCHFTGTCGLKPTPDRMTKKGMATLSKDGKSGQRIVNVTVGPIANCVADLEMVMTALCSPIIWDGDASLPRLPWDKAVAKDGPGRPLKVGFFTTDDWFEPCKTVTRAVCEAAEGLRAAGHEVVAFKPPATGWEIARLFYGQMGAEGNMKRFVDALDGEPMLPEYESLRKITRIPNLLRPFLRWLLRVVVRDYRKASMLGVTRNHGVSVRQYYELVGDTFVLRSKWEEAVVSAGLDAVIFPPAALPALPHGTSKDLTPAFTYMFLANLLQWPAGVVPAAIVRPDEEDYDVEGLPVKQRDVTARFARAALKGSAGLPVGVQVMTMPFKEELALYAMREVERAVKFDAVPKVAGL